MSKITTPPWIKSLDPHQGFHVQASVSIDHPTDLDRPPHRSPISIHIWQKGAISTFRYLGRPLKNFWLRPCSHRKLKKNHSQLVAKKKNMKRVWGMTSDKYSCYTDHPLQWSRVFNEGTSYVNLNACTEICKLIKQKLFENNFHVK